ncbi:MAG: hypothetical protein P1P76_08720 [Anaerolineales bacterium]|nr:hypothetical protein [Anaerolineales bacterium]
MSESLRIWVEIIFNLLYLMTIWVIVIAMTRRLDKVPPPDLRVARYFILAFALLAIGDTGHVGFRVWAYALGNPEARVYVSGLTMGLVGLGALSTAITVTLFYVVMLYIWAARFEKRFGVFGGILMLSAVVRLGLMTLPQNQWNLTVPPHPWSLWRNLPLVVLGLGVAFLMMRDALRANDRAFQWIGIMILLSYGFYIPVMLFIQRAPVIGMLMIPKTLAYVAIAVIGYLSIFQPAESPLASAELSSAKQIRR